MANDTIYGELQYQSDMMSISSCIFKNDTLPQTSYSPEELKAYRFTGGKYYISKYVYGLENRRQFVEYLVDGEKDAYYFRDKNGHHYLVGDTDSLLELRYKEKTVIQNGKEFLVKEKQYLTMLEDYLGDQDILSKQIKRSNTLSRSRLIKMTKKYHDLYCPEGICEVYGKQKYPFRMKVALSRGVGEFVLEAEEARGKGSVQQQGALLSFWLPKANENLYLQVGVLQNNITFYNEEEGDASSRFYFIPLRFQYVFSGKFIQPRITVGSDMLFMPIFHASVGAQLNLHKRWALGADVYGQTALFNLSQYGSNLTLSYRFGK
ncbi:hypothetical protein GCM10023331_12460 [Algivirga pacifica]|uniref:Outer membrane protein beta-barrel domain-containing protein n=2 Tax=Algivirga pacifica TaxID=1162670 RepID=A0ABP9D4H9_9BACT